MKMWINYLLIIGVLNLVVLLNVSGVRIPLFITPLKALPQPIAETSSFYSSRNRDKFFSKVTAWDVWQATKLPLPEIYNWSVHDIISNASLLYTDSVLQTDQLKVHMCGSHCYSLNISDIEYYSKYSGFELTGQTNPPITLGQFHEAVVTTLEAHFYFTMSYVEQEVGQSSFNVTLPEWKQFVYYIADHAIQCRADILDVERLEFAELMRSDEVTLRNYTLAELDSKLISPYLSILYNKYVFEDEEIGVYIAGSKTLDDWSSCPLYYYIYPATSFTIRDLEILYDWNSTQLYALQFIPLSSYNSCAGVISLARSMYNISGLILEDFSCRVALLLSSSVRHVQTISSAVRNPLELSVLRIFTAVTGIESWIDTADILELNYTHGLIIDTPRLREIVRDNNGITGDILDLSVPQIIANYISLNDEIYKSNRYAPMFNDMLSAYGFSDEELFEASGESVTSETTITEIHRWLLRTISIRYYVHNISDLIGYTEYFTNDLDLVALPSSEWSRIIDAVIQQSFKQVMQAFSYDLEADPESVKIYPGIDNFQTIVTIGIPSSFDNQYISRTSSCLFNKTIDFFQSGKIAAYHRFYNDTIAKTMNKKIMFETTSFEDFLSEWDYDLEDLDDVSLLESIKMATDLKLFEIECLYEDSTSSLLKSQITWGDVGDRLCHSFVNLTLFEIVTSVEAAPTANCDKDDKVKCSSSPCQTNEDCMEAGSGFECFCKTGFSGDTSCTDVDECGGGSSPCHSDAMCKNVIGSYTCSCKTGFTGNGKSQCTVLDTGSSNPSSSSNNNIGIIIGVVVAAMVVIVTVILVVAWFFYRRKPRAQKSNDIGNISNAAYVGDKQLNRGLPRVPESEDGYEEPSDYAQLNTFKRVPIDANYQSLTLKSQPDAGYTDLEKKNENNYQRYATLEMNSNPEYDTGNEAGSYVTVMDGPKKEGPNESIYEELP